MRLKNRKPSDVFWILLWGILHLVAIGGIIHFIKYPNSDSIITIALQSFSIGVATGLLTYWAVIGSFYINKQFDNWLKTKDDEFEKRNKNQE